MSHAVASRSQHCTAGASQGCRAGPGPRVPVGDWLWLSWVLGRARGWPLPRCSRCLASPSDGPVPASLCTCSQQPALIRPPPALLSTPSPSSPLPACLPPSRNTQQGLKGVPIHDHRYYCSTSQYPARLSVCAPADPPPASAPNSPRSRRQPPRRSRSLTLTLSPLDFASPATPPSNAPDACQPAPASACTLLRAHPESCNPSDPTRATKGTRPPPRNCYNTPSDCCEFLVSLSSQSATAWRVSGVAPTRAPSTRCAGPFALRRCGRSFPTAFLMPSHCVSFIAARSILRATAQASAEAEAAPSLVPACTVQPSDSVTPLPSLASPTRRRPDRTPRHHLTHLARRPSHCPSRRGPCPALTAADLAT